MKISELINADCEHLIHPLHHPVDTATPVIYVRGRGAIIEDSEGRQYLDGLSALWNVNVGHGRAELADAAAAQMRELAYFSSYAGSSNIPSIELADRLVGLAYDNMQAVFFTTGGAEANESAFKTARFHWRANGKPAKTKMIARQQGYHGVTLQAMSATSMGSYWKMFEPRVPGFVHVRSCYPYRLDTKPGETAGQAAARELEEAIRREGADTVAAFVAEPIHGAGGVIYPTDDYWPLVREICTRHDVLLISDEIITAFCRTGRWFALGHWNVQPDIVSFAKGVTSGYLPLGGIIVSKAIKNTIDSVESADRWMHGFTYSAHPTCCAVASVNLDILEREHLAERATEMGNRLHAGLRRALDGHAHVGDIRGGKGLLAAVEFVENVATKENFQPNLKFARRLQAEMVNRGLVTRTIPAAGPHPAPGDTVVFAPPLIVTEAEVDRLVGIVKDAVDAVL